VAPSEAHDRSYLQSRLREEIARSKRHGRPFGVLVFEEVPSADGLRVRQKLEYGLKALSATARNYDIVGGAYDDTIAVLLIEADARGMRDALFRFRARMTRQAGTWRVTAYHYPEDAETIEALPLLSAV
jgi:hypothetical protein